MKKSSIIISSAAALVALIAVSGFAFGSFAADGDTTTDDTAFTRPCLMGGLSGENREQFLASREEFRAEMDARRETVQAALRAGDYDAWVEAVGEDAPILEQINRDNFNRFVEARQYMEQGREIMEELGVEGRGFGRIGAKGGMVGFHGQGGMWK